MTHGPPMVTNIPLLQCFLNASKKSSQSTIEENVTGKPDPVATENEQNPNQSAPHQAEEPSDEGTDNETSSLQTTPKPAQEKNHRELQTAKNELLALMRV